VSNHEVPRIPPIQLGPRPDARDPRPPHERALDGWKGSESIARRAWSSGRGSGDDGGGPLNGLHAAIGYVNADPALIAEAIRIAKVLNALSR